ncbi:hypothetical protein [Vibrio gigantis]|uniref:hypothetical protein n=1 Tax=Vibrio gigantis TaxID=296199 RepID=UPI001BFDE017|nr:hypothetical protein [Vibrio gigantis]
MIEAIVLSILLGWGWTELTTEPVCQQEIIKQGVKYSVPVNCSVVIGYEES